MRYSFSKCFLASFKGAENVFSNKSLLLIKDDEGLRVSSIILFILLLDSLADKIVILSTKFLNSLTLPGQS